MSGAPLIYLVRTDKALVYTWYVREWRGGIAGDTLTSLTRISRTDNRDVNFTLKIASELQVKDIS